MAWVALFALITAAPAAASNLLIQSGGDPDNSTIFVDSSADGTTHAITAHNTARHETDQAKFGSSSIYINRYNNGYLTVANSTDLDFGSGDFTIDCWVKLNSTGANWNYAMSTMPNGNFAVAIDNRTPVTTMVPRLQVTYFDGQVHTTSKDNATIGNQNWHHIALTRSGQTFRYFLDGIQQESWTSAKALKTPTVGMGVGARSDGSTGDGDYTAFHGYLEEIRVFKGQAVWTSNFPVPAEPYTEGGAPQTPDPGSMDGNANLLVQSGEDWTVSGEFEDTSSTGTNHTITTVGEARHETGQHYYGSSSIYIDRYNNGRLMVGNSADLDFGAGDFTIDCWVRMASQGANWNYVFSTIPNGGVAIAIDNNGGGTQYMVPRVQVVYADGEVVTTSSQNRQIGSQQWHYIMLTRKDGTFYYFLDGAMLESWHSAKALKTPTAGAGVGARSDGTTGDGADTAFKGHLEEVRIVKTKAERVETFQPPSNPYGAQDHGIFGVDAGAWYQSSNNSLQFAKNNNFMHVRYFMNEPKPENLAYMSDAHNKGMKVLGVMGPGSAFNFELSPPEREQSYWLNEYDANNDIKLSSPEFAVAVTDRLNNLRTYINNGTFVGIQLGNEEDIKWWNGRPSDTGDPHYMIGSKNEAGHYPANEDWSGDFDDGRDYGEFYLEAYKAIKDDPDFSKLIVVGGSIFWHENIAWGSNVTGGFGSSGEFIRGYLDYVLKKGIQGVLQGVISDRYSYMPDALSLHSYVVDHPPEWDIYYDSGDGRFGTPYFERLKQYTDLADGYGVNVQFYDTEHGNGYKAPLPGSKVLAPYPPRPYPDGIDEINPNVYTQSVYYLRSLMIKSNTQYGNRKWNNMYYWTHPDNGLSGFFSTVSESSKRPIHGIAQHLFPETKLGQDDTFIWIPISWTNPSASDREGVAVCGWRNGSDYWAAIWRYKNRLDLPYGYRYYFKPVSSDSVGFTISRGEFVEKEVRRFNFGDPISNPVYPTFAYGQIDTVTTEYDPFLEKTQVVVYDVTENPIFIKFEYEK